MNQQFMFPYLGRGLNRGPKYSAVKERSAGSILVFLLFSEFGMKAASREAALFHEVPYICDVPYVEALGVHQERCALAVYR